MTASTYRRFLLAALPAVGFLGMATDASALGVLAVAGFAMLARAWWLARRALPALTVRREVYPSAFEDDAVAVEVVLDNRARRAVSLVEITDCFGPGVADRQVLLDAGPLRDGRRRRLRYRTFCSRPWGLYTVGPLSLRTSDPLGLFEGTRGFPQIEPFAVFPRLHPMAGLDRLGSRPSAAPQLRTLGRPGQSSLYVGVRDYRPGDDLRRVHWPATARRGTLTVKEYEVDLVPYFTLFLDLERRHRAGTGRKSTLEYVVRTAACLVAAAIERGDTVQVIGEGRGPLFVPPGRGQFHLAHCLHELIQSRQDGAIPILDLVESHRFHLPEGSTAALLLGTTSVDDGRLEELLQSLGSRNVHPLLMFVDSHSFIPIDHRGLPREQARERTRQIESFLKDRGVLGAVLAAEDELAEELGRPDRWGDTT